MRSIDQSVELIVRERIGNVNGEPGFVAIVS